MSTRSNSKINTFSLTFSSLWKKSLTTVLAMKLQNNVCNNFTKV